MSNGITDATQAASGSVPGSRLDGAWIRSSSVYIAFATLIILDLFVTPGFRNPAVIRSLLFDSAPVILIALGQSLAIGTRGIDLSVGSVMALSSSIIGITLSMGQNASMVFGIGTGLACGVINGLLVAVLRLDPLISSLSLLVAARGLAQAILGGARMNLPFDGPIPWLGAATVSVIPVTALIALGAAIIFAFVVKRTTLGHYAIYAGASRTAAFLAGQPVRATLAFVYGLSGLLAGGAGLFATARLGAADPNYIGVQFELDAIAAAVIGGTPLSGGRISVVGTIFGVLLLEVLDASFIMNDISATYAQILKAAFIVGALYLQRAGG
jgi:galactofuranose transport system permease protein